MNKVIERLRSECILNAEEDSGFSRDVLWLCNEAEDMSAELDIAKQRIEHLEAALQKIESYSCPASCDNIARDALAEDRE